MKRSEQDIRFQWDLTKIYPDTAAWEAAMQEAEAALAPLAAIPGTLGTSKEAFKKGLDTVYASMFKVEMPYVYAFLKKTEDGSVAENQEMAARSESLLVKFSAATAFIFFSALFRRGIDLPRSRTPCLLLPDRFDQPVVLQPV